MRGRIKTPLPWVMMTAMIFIGVMLMTLLIPMADLWSDSWRVYAMDTRLGGICAANPELLNCRRLVEPWQLVRYASAAGFAVVIFGLSYPYVYHRDDEDDNDG